MNLLDFKISVMNSSRGIKPFCFLSSFLKKSTTRDRLCVWNFKNLLRQSSQSKDLMRSCSLNRIRCSCKRFWRSHAINQTFLHLSHKILPRGERKSASLMALKEVLQNQLIINNKQVPHRKKVNQQKMSPIRSLYKRKSSQYDRFYGSDDGKTINN